MTITEKLNALYFTVISHEEEVKRHLADSILVASSIAEDDPERCIVMTRPHGVEYFNLDYLEEWSKDKALYYHDVDYEGCHWYLLDFEKIEGNSTDESEELAPTDAVNLIVDAYKKGREE